MKKEKTTSTKISAYSSLAVSLVAMASGAADAQVIYTDIIDVTVSNDGGIYKLDLDNSGSIDFNIFRLGNKSTGTYNAVSCDATGLNGIVGNSNSASALVLNTTIASSNSWQTGAADLLMASSSSNSAKTGPWVAKKDHYLGLMLMISGSPHYGWARLDVNKLCNTFVIKDYAYDKTAKAKILAGDMGNTTSVTNIDGAEVKVFASDNSITVNCGSAAPELISVKNVLGQEVKAVKATEAKTVVDMNGMPSGIYFVTVTIGGSASTTKVFVGQ